MDEYVRGNVDVNDAGVALIKHGLDPDAARFARFGLSTSGPGLVGIAYHMSKLEGPVWRVQTWGPVKSVVWDCPRQVEAVPL